MHFPLNKVDLSTLRRAVLLVTAALSRLGALCAHVSLSLQNILKSVKPIFIGVYSNSQRGL